MEEKFKRILVPVDFSDGSINAFKLAGFFAKDRDASIILAHIISEPQLTDPVYSSEYFSPSTVADLKSDLEDKISADYISEIEKEIDIKIVIRRGYPPSEIVSLIDDEGADLIIMGTHGRKGLTHLLLGSVTEKIIRNSRIPVVTLKTDNIISSESLSIKKILVPYDFSELSEKSFELAERIASFYDAEIDLVYVNQPITYYPYYLSENYSEENVLERIDKEIKGKLDSVVKTSSDNKCRKKTFVVRGEPYEAILGLADEMASNLIIMGTHGRSGIAHVVIGSVAERVIRASHIPVITIRF